MWAAVLGSPIAHSLSPALHRAAYAKLGLSSWHYDGIECDAAALAGLLQRARTDGDFGGYSLTMPLKLTVLPLLDALEPLASRVGAVNTVVPRRGGLYGANTDVPGLVNALREAGVDTPSRPVVLGGGGSAQAAVASLALLGASRVAVCVRNPARGAALRTVAAGAGIDLAVEAWDPAVMRGADLVISAVPATAGDDLSGWLQQWRPETTLFDLVYAPWPTPLARAALAAGSRVLGGLDLLIHQAVGQIELMTGSRVDVAVLRAAGERALRPR